MPWSCEQREKGGQRAICHIAAPGVGEGEGSSEQSVKGLTLRNEVRAEDGPWTPFVLRGGILKSLLGLRASRGHQGGESEGKGEGKAQTRNPV